MLWDGTLAWGHHACPDSSLARPRWPLRIAIIIRRPQTAVPEEGQHTMPAHDQKTAESVAPEQRSETLSPLDPVPQETRKKRAQMLSKEAVTAFLTGQISSLQELAITNAKIQDTMPSKELDRSAAPGNIKARE